MSIQQRCSISLQSVETKENTVLRPLDEMSLEWESMDKARSGKTTLKSRIRKLEKCVVTEEAAIDHNMELLRQVNIELHQILIEAVGEDECKEDLQANISGSIRDTKHQISSNRHEIQSQFELDEFRWCDTIEKINCAAMERMRESERVTLDSCLPAIMV